jgi:1-acyl-sn-glycerol-3-phosphate acyltransferase
MTESSRLIDAILDFIAADDLLAPADIRAALQREIDAAGPDGLHALKARLSADDGWTYYRPDPLARRVHHLLADAFLESDSEVHGIEHVSGLPRGPVVVFANHLSYSDANVVEVLLHRAGGDALADRLTAVAGPKVFTSRQRRFSSLCFGTVKVPQSADVSSGEAVLNARDVARAARRALDVAHDRLTAGDALLIFGEGTRSRSGAMQPMLAGVARYVDEAGTTILPIGLTGSEKLFPIGEAAIRPARVSMRIGPPIDAADLLARARGDRRVVVEAIGRAIAALLPPAYRGVYGS